jgi:hypothetical protein
MTDELYSRRPVAGWYMIAAVGSLVFMALGCAMYLIHVTADPASLQPDQRALFEAEPMWVLGASAIGFWVGLAGAVLLLIRRRLAQPLLLVSLVAILVWLAGILLAPNFRDLVTVNDIAVAVIVTAISWTIFWFARHSNQRGWLR